MASCSLQLLQQVSPSPLPASYLLTLHFLHPPICYTGDRNSSPLCLQRVEGGVLATTTKSVLGFFPPLMAQIFGQLRFSELILML